MDKHRDSAKYFAVLIGIDFYREAPLQGCVRDVLEIAKYLKHAQPEAEVHTFTASLPGDTKSSVPAEDRSLWPTFENVVPKIQEVASIARPGDHIHVHYSGHGTRVEPSGDLALDLLGDMQKTGVRYLRGTEFALLLQSLVVKKLEVSVVLDCCFSGGVSRDDSSVRYLHYNPMIDATYPAATQVLERVEAPSSHRNVSMRHSWLVDPDGYTIITACGPHEKAREIRLPDGKRHGALSYFFLRTLIGLGGLGKKQGYIYRHLCARFKTSWPQQNPMLYGNRDKSFFSHGILEAQTTPIQTIKKKDGTLQLQAGQAQGIRNGDRFAIYPFGSMERTLTTCQDSSVATVTYAGALQSTLEVSEPTSIGTQTWWTAVALTRNYLKKYAIRIPEDTPFREDWAAALEERSLRANAEDESPFVSVVGSEDNNYGLLDKSAHEITAVSAMEQVQTTSDQLCDVIQHLAKFNMVKDLANDAPRNSFEKSFTISLVDSSGNTFCSGSSIQVDHNSMVSLIVENEGERELYVYIYDMGPEWQVENILQGNHDVLPPRHKYQAPDRPAKKTWKLMMEVPDEMKEKGQHNCSDTIIVFLTAQLTSFDLLELPKLNHVAKRKTTKKTCRGGDGLSLEDWACFSFSIATHIR
ncbi:caspase domain-containing protein [Colletotrichum somersetense]|nr:caspase domain-containing protein [Colletotrichum somersetense]